MFDVFESDKMLKKKNTQRVVIWTTLEITAILENQAEQK